jgi:hypothetical protein
MKKIWNFLNTRDAINKTTKTTKRIWYILVYCIKMKWNRTRSAEVRESGRNVGNNSKLFFSPIRIHL